MIRIFPILFFLPINLINKYLLNKIPAIKAHSIELKHMRKLGKL